MLLALLPSLSLVQQAIQTPVQRRDYTLLSPRAERIDLLKNADYEYILAKMPSLHTLSFPTSPTTPRRHSSCTTAAPTAFCRALSANPRSSNSASSRCPRRR